MTQVPSENLPRRQDTEEVVMLEFQEVGQHTEAPVLLWALAVEMTEEEVGRATEQIRGQVEALSTAFGAEPPPALLEKLEELESGGDHTAVVFGPFEMCFN